MSVLRRQQRSELVKLTVFLMFSAFLAFYMVVVTSEARPGEYRDYRATFKNVSGLEAGDKVRAAGVVVGKVKSVTVSPDATVQVAFDVDKNVELNSSTRATVKYRNLIGGRVLELSRPDAKSAALPAGATIPVDRTASALDLDTLLNGFKPLFAGLNPSQINELASQLVGVLQGQTTAVRTLVTTVGSFTSTIADREGLLSDVITNLNTVMGTFDQNRQGLGQLVTELSGLVSGLADQDKQIVDAAASIDDFSTRASKLIREARSDLTPDLQELARTAAGINSSTDTLETVLNRLPGHYRMMLNTASYGNFFNFFLCGVRVQLTNGAGQPIQTPWIISDVARCHR